MKSSDSLREFESSIGHEVSALTPEQGVMAMLQFYREKRVVDCDLEQDGDMLLFQWGTYDWGKGLRFEFDITRQFIGASGEDENIWQLSLTFLFSPTDELRRLGSDNRWCSRPDQSVEFESFIVNSLAFRAVASRLDAVPERDYQCAG